MSIKKSISIIASAFIFFLIVFIGFILLADPEEAGTFGLVIILASLISALLSFFTLSFLILYFRFIKNKDKIFEQVLPAFRQAMFVSIFLISFPVLQYLRILQWWSILAVLLILVLLEVVFSLRKKKIKYIEEKK